MKCDNPDCTKPPLSGFTACLSCIHKEAEERHQEDKARWAREAEQTKESDEPREL